MLDDEFLKSFLFSNPFSEEYAERMQLEEWLLVVLQQTTILPQIPFEKVSNRFLWA
jgi:hypothetical protein